MRISRQRRQKPKSTRIKETIDPEKAGILAGIKNGTIIAVYKSKVFSRSALPQIPDYYRDTWFTCKDCGDRELWTAKQQQRWYEEQGGEIEAIAIRCRACRRKEKLRRETSRKTHLEGMAKKRKTTV
jgi:hypothetical protein